MNYSPGPYGSGVFLSLVSSPPEDSHDLQGHLETNGQSPPRPNDFALTAAAVKDTAK